MVNSFSITGGLEIIQVAESVAREKNLKRDIVISALEAAVVSVARKKYGHDINVKAEISEKDGSIRIFRILSIVEVAEDHNTQIELKYAKKKNPDAEIGGEISEELPPIDFGRVAGQTFKQVLMQKIREAERDREFEEFKDRVGEIASGVVERIENNGDLVINFGKTETILPKNELIPRENYRKGDRIRAFISDVRKERKGPQIFLSRRSNEFLAALFTQEVPEIYDGLVKIYAVARDAGSRAKVAVYSEDSSIDAVGSCIGPRGSRVTAVYNELQGEKIDIIEWSNDLATLAVNAIGSKTKDSIVQVVKIIIDEDNHKVIAVVPDENLSIAIGRRGQNVKLASELIGWNIDIISESDDATRSQEEFARLTKLFSEALNVEEVIAQLLVSEGFTRVDEVAFVSRQDLLSIEGFEEELVDELQKRAEEWVANNPKEEKAETPNERRNERNTKKGLPGINGMTNDMIELLIKKGVHEVEDLAELASDELLEIIESENVDKTLADSMIMEARRKAGWFKDERKRAF